MGRLARQVEIGAVGWTRPPPRSLQNDETSGGGGADTLLDLRFRTLVGPEAWAVLPAPVRRRFSKRLHPGAAITFVGEIVESRRNPAGALLAQLCRLFGAPLPLCDDVGVPAVVTVTEDARSGGQFWSRLYGRAHRPPQVIHSSKRFAGPTGLEEYLGGGVGIALTVHADAEALRFVSRGYFVALGGRRFALPGWLSPGELSISHVERGGGAFAFVLALRHPRLGDLLNQTAVFRDGPTASPELAI